MSALAVQSPAIGFSALEAARVELAATHDRIRAAAERYARRAARLALAYHKAGDAERAAFQLRKAEGWLAYRDRIGMAR